MRRPSSKTIAPGPKGLSFLKVLWDFYRDPIELFPRLYRDFGEVVRLEGMGYCAHLITQPEHVKHVLQDNAKNYQLSGIFQETSPIVGKGLTTNNGPSWLKQRRMVQSAFQHRDIPAYAETIIQYAEEGLRRWQINSKNGHPINIEAETLKINLRILGKLLFSVDFKMNDPFLKSLAIVRKVSIKQARSLFKLPSGPRFWHAVKVINEFAYEQIESRSHGDPYRDILSMMMESTILRSEVGMNNQELRDEAITLFFAAYEDVANCLAWTWYLLSQNPDIENKLRTEIRKVLGDRAPTASDLQSLPYLTMTVNEVLRLYPTTWSLLREAIIEDEIGGFLIPVGSTIIMDLQLTHRLPKFWDEPDRFDPVRFSAEQTTGIPRFAYFPFGGGPRQCIGNELALMEIKLILTRMIQMYRYSLVSKIPVQMNPLSSLQPRNGVWMKILPV